MGLLRLFFRRFGVIAVTLTVYDVWRSLPMSQRRWLVAHGRRQGLRIVTRAGAFVAGSIGR